MENKKIYLAIPYNDLDPTVRQRRFEIANQVSADLFNKGYNVFSPISHSHPIAVQCDLPKGYDFWSKWNATFIEWCDELHVICIEGWRESGGVQDEIKIAERLGKEVRYIRDGYEGM